MSRLLFIDDGVEFDSILLKEKAFGGAEVAFVSLVEELAKLNFEVTVYNNCKNQGVINNVNWKKLDGKVDSEKFDILIINRGDKFLNFKKECRKRFFWIHNPARYLLKYRYLSKLFFNPSTIIFSSKFHYNTYPFWAPSKQRVIIPYGVENFLFKNQKKRFPPNPEAIFTSNPLRELDWILDQWETSIFPSVKRSKLLIFSGPNTYGKFGKKHSLKMRKVLERAKSLKDKGVIVKEPLERKELFKKIRKSRIFLYKGTDDETFCMSAAESQMLGTPAVVCKYGCMDERVEDSRTGFVCDDSVQFCQKTINLLVDDNLWKKMNLNMVKNKNHHSWAKIAKKWKKILV